MLGAIIGDIIGSRFEFDNYRATDFELFSVSSVFTDDSVLTVASAKVLLEAGDYSQAYRDFSRRYPGRLYGGRFLGWIADEKMGPYNSFGNGSAMRVSPVGFAFSSLEETLAEASRSASVTHDHPEGIKGAQAVAQAIFMAREGEMKEAIQQAITREFGYDFSRSIEQIRRSNLFDETCQGSVPEALSCFFASKDFEDCIRLSVSIGGDTDTIACIAGGVAQAFFQDIPSWIVDESLKRLPQEFLDILYRFEQAFPVAGRY